MRKMCLVLSLTLYPTHESIDFFHQNCQTYKSQKAYKELGDSGKTSRDVGDQLYALLLPNEISDESPKPKCLQEPNTEHRSPSL